MDEQIIFTFGFQPFSTEVSDKSHIFGKEFIYHLMGREVSQSVGHLRCFTKKALCSVVKYYHFKTLKEVSCHVLPWNFNKFITKLLPNLSETHQKHK